MSMKSLDRRLTDYCEKSGLPQLSADDLIAELEMSRMGAASQIPDTIKPEDKSALIKWLESFQRVYDRVAGEEIAIQHLIIEALKHGYETVLVDDGEEIHDVVGLPLSEIIELTMAVDESSITVKGKLSGDKLRFYLIFGNSPEELIADHTDHPDAELIWQAVQARV